MKIKIVKKQVYLCLVYDDDDDASRELQVDATLRGGDVPFVPGMPFGADRVEGDTCKSLLVDVLGGGGTVVGGARSCVRLTHELERRLVSNIF